MERFVEVHRRVEGEQRRLGDLAHRSRAWIATFGDDLPHERLARDHAGEPAVVDHEDRTNGGIGQALPRLLCACRDIERTRLGHHRIPDVLSAHRPFLGR